MASSTSPSRAPRFALLLVLVIVVTWAMGSLYTLYLNPEIRYWRGVAEIAGKYADKLSAERGTKTIAFGGSSCAFSINGERLLEKHDLPVVNFGLHAGMGPKVPALVAREHLRPGDTLIVALEPFHLTDPLDPPALGVQFSFVLGHPGWITQEELGARLAPPLSALLDLRPGGYHLFTLTGKILMGRPLYRYALGQVRPSGWQQTQDHLTILAPPEIGPHLSDGAKVFLHGLRDWCDTHGVRVAYSLPWAYVPQDESPALQRKSAAFLSEVAELMPVLKDPRLGAHSVLEHFSDSCWHLNGAGADLRTDSLADQLRHWSVWERAELEQLARD